ncbi:MAG: N(5)-(carboxyethyl)ornithine synthase [Longicatena sp.]
MNKTIGFVKSDKLFEKRLAILPEDIMKITHKDSIFIEEGYGKDFGIEDECYNKAGVHVESRKQVLTCDIVCDPKIGEAKYLKDLKEHTQLFGWIHAVEDPKLTSLLVDKKFVCYAWEELTHNGRHLFWENNFIAGESAVLHALQCLGILAYGKQVAIIGRGNTAMGANYIIQSLGGKVKFFNRQMEHELRDEIGDFDIVINAVLWDPSRVDHILYHKDLQHMKPQAMLIDVSDDADGAIEGARSTTIKDPLYEMDGVMVYAVNNTPSLYYRSATSTISPLIADYVDALITSKEEILKECKIISCGVIHDEKITTYQTSMQQKNKAIIH